MTYICTVDVDWVPGPLLKDTLDIAAEYDIPLTVFSTHDDGVSIDSRHERALHPNFLSEETEKEALDQIAKQYPQATGIRSHSLYIHTRLRDLYGAYDLDYESNYLMEGASRVEPFFHYRDVVQLPISFMDDMWLRRGSDPEVINELSTREGTKVLVFHPIHVFINTPNIEYYQTNKDYYKNVQALREVRYDGFGVRSLFEQMLESISNAEEPVHTAGSFVDEFKNDHSGT